MNELSVVVPCLSASNEIPLFLDRLAAELMKNPTDIDVIVVTHEAADNPQDIAAHVKRHYPWLQCTVLVRRGGARRYGSLVRFGMAYAASRYVAFVSPYNEDDVSILFKMLDEVRRGAQLAQATRYADAAERATSTRYHLYQRLYRSCVRLLVGEDITDSTYAYRVFDRTFVLALGVTHNGYSVCPEITLKSMLAGGCVVSVPSAMQTSPLNRDFHLWREGLGYARVLARAGMHRVGVSWF